jgi:hypothetical protein
MAGFRRRFTDKNYFFSDQAVNLGSLDWFLEPNYGQELLFWGLGGKFGEWGFVSGANLRTRIVFFRIRL